MKKSEISGFDGACAALFRDRHESGVRYAVQWRQRLEIFCLYTPEGGADKGAHCTARSEVGRAELMLRQGIDIVTKSFQVTVKKVEEKKKKRYSI